MKGFERKLGVAWVGILLAIGLILIGVAVAIGPAGIDFGFDFGWSLDGQRFDRSYQESLNDAIKSIDIYTLNGEVEIIGWEESFISLEVKQTVKVSSEDLKEKYFEETKPVVTVLDGLLKIVTPRLQQTGEFRGQGASIYLRVPIELLKEVVARTSNGKMKAASLNSYINVESSNGGIEVYSINGRVVAETSNGPINARDIIGPMQFQSSNGSFTGTRLEGDLRITTSNASINVENSSSNISALTSNGSINITDCTLMGTTNSFRTSNSKVTVNSALPSQGTLELTSSNGQIVLFVPEDIRAYIDASTSNGRVDITGLSITVSSMSKTSIKGNLNNGSDLDITLRTSNADIVIKKK
ncbi:MAG TPA: DUF4097 family beta strand repeat-containing protein [Mesotoga infera]|nr:DUF4097 domain-containing protein [Thermotogaceae bacterium]HNR80526.1 DUF4097 family beta strand repeat-containing protein [Mesotoga infera]HRR44621.1 DUF4097 family beta strand repeat-containing protein [Mesotoga sp.]HNS66855.1 DUF4097 family beta strand repeat-containing protein [Mesotoga infera]HOI34769.1 DUF4097 family beta strand repeat-containing protein [Mesotoga infera]